MNQTVLLEYYIKTIQAVFETSFEKHQCFQYFKANFQLKFKIDFFLML